MSTKNGVAYRQWLVATSKHNIKAPYSMVPKKITYHNTDNQMPAHNEISYMRNNNLYVSYHLAIDEKEAVQGLPFNRNGYHAGDGANGYGNRNTIGIEICRNYDRSRGTTNLLEPLKSQYSKAEENAVKVGAAVMYELNIAPTLDNIKFHQDWSGKWCPSKILNERRGSAFKAFAVAEALKYKSAQEGIPIKPVEKPKPAEVTSNIANKSIDLLVTETLAGKYGNGEARKNNLGDKFSAVQSRINAMHSSGGTPAKSTQELVNEVLAGKHGNGDARKKSLGSRYKEVQEAINRGAGSSSTSTSSSTSVTIKEGAVVTVSRLYGKGADTSPARTTPISGTIDRINSNWRNPIRLVNNKGVYIGFARHADVRGGTVSTSKPTPAPKPKPVTKPAPKPAPKPVTVPAPVKKGDKVRIKSSAKTYSTGQAIPANRKNVTYTVQQTGSQGVLLQEIVSWVRVSDVTKVGTTGTSAPKKKTVDQMAREVIAGKHGTGHTNRRRSLGISQAEYEKVRRRVNQLA